MQERNTVSICNAQRADVHLVFTRKAFQVLMAAMLKLSFSDLGHQSVHRDMEIYFGISAFLIDLFPFRSPCEDISVRRISSFDDFPRHSVVVENSNQIIYI